MEYLVQQIINAVSLGGIYALLALGLAVVFSIVGLINFAHGELMTVAGYVIFFMLSLAAPLVAAVMLGIAASAIAALTTERLAFRPMRKADVTGLLITSFAVSARPSMSTSTIASVAPRSAHRTASERSWG